MHNDPGLLLITHFCSGLLLISHKMMQSGPGLLLITQDTVDTFTLAGGRLTGCAVASLSIASIRLVRTCVSHPTTLVLG